MIGLREAAGDAILDVRARNCVDPIAHDASAFGVRLLAAALRAVPWATALQTEVPSEFSTMQIFYSAWRIRVS